MPVVVHVEEVTQPQGHSTSGSHERYKSEERLAWAKEYDCIVKLGEFIVVEGAATQEDLDAIRKEAKKEVRSLQKEAWKEFREDIDGELATVANLIKGLEGADSQRAASLEKELDPGRADVMIAARRSLQDTNGTTSLSVKPSKTGSLQFLKRITSGTTLIFTQSTMITHSTCRISLLSTRLNLKWSTVE